MDVFNKRVVLRVDYNVPIKNGVILDDTKIKLTIETINYLLDKNCSIVILSHLGKVRSLEDMKTLSLELVSQRLKQLLGRDVYFSRENYGPSVLQRVLEMTSKDILLLENTRFLDVPHKLESNCDSQLAEFWSSLGDVFVNDAFGVSHRKHASTYGISLYLPSCIGFLMQKEIEVLNEKIINCEHPFTLIMGGAKMDDKMDLLDALLPKCDYILCGGGIANTCLKALGFHIGESIFSSNSLVFNKTREKLFQYKDKFMLPLDVIVGSTYDKNYVNYKLVDKVDDNEKICDIGNRTLEKYKDVIMKSKTIFLNGTVGMYENMKFANGTKELFSILSSSNACVVIGGGDAAASVYNLGYDNSFSFISSGGGATLEYLATSKLVALEAMVEEGSDVETLDM